MCSCYPCQSPQRGCTVSFPDRSQTADNWSSGNRSWGCSAHCRLDGDRSRARCCMPGSPDKSPHRRGSVSTWGRCRGPDSSTGPPDRPRRLLALVGPCGRHHRHSPLVLLGSCLSGHTPVLNIVHVARRLYTHQPCPCI